MEGNFFGENKNIPFLSHIELKKDVKSYLKSGDMHIPRATVLPSSNQRKLQSVMATGTSPEKMMGQSIFKSFEATGNINKSVIVENSRDLFKPTLHDSTAASSYN